jgi:hypothetical protein
MKEKPYYIGSKTFVGYSGEHTPAVLKISYGKVYVIVKCKSQPGAIRNIENSLNAFIRGGKNNPDGLYFHLYNYVKAHPDNKFKTEILLESNSGYQLLKKEKQELDKGKVNPQFLNNQTEPYIPPFNDETDMFGWLKKNEVLNYYRWLKITKRVNKLKAINEALR